MDHHKQEDADGHEIWPATPKSGQSGNGQGDIDFFNKLEACAESDSLKW